MIQGKQWIEPDFLEFTLPRDAASAALDGLVHDRWKPPPDHGRVSRALVRSQHCPGSDARADPLQQPLDALASLVSSWAVLFARNLGQTPLCRHHGYVQAEDEPIGRDDQGDAQGFALAVLGGFHLVKLDMAEGTLGSLNLIKQLFVPLAQVSSHEDEFSCDGLDVDLEYGRASALSDVGVIEHEDVVIDVSLVLAVAGTGGGLREIGTARLAQKASNLFPVRRPPVTAFADYESYFQTLFEALRLMDRASWKHKARQEQDPSLFRRIDTSSTLRRTKREQFIKFVIRTRRRSH